MYLPLSAGVATGVILSALLVWATPRQSHRINWPARVPWALGQFLFWLGVPISIVGFMRRADLSGNLYLAPVVAWVAMLLGWGCSRLWMATRTTAWSRPTQGSFSLASMLGNTGYIGYPVVLLLPQLGLDVFGWAIFYDALGTLLGSYGLGAILASEYGDRQQASQQAQWLSWLLQVVRNPIIWAFGLGLLLKLVWLPSWLDASLYAIAWAVVMLSLVLMGMRIHQITSWQHLGPAVVVISIKMLILPLAVGLGLTALGVHGAPRLILTLQAGMPCAFSNLVLAEAYDLDRELSVTCVGLSSITLVLTLPLWLWGFSGGA